MGSIEGESVNVMFDEKLYNIENRKLLDYLYVNHGIIFKNISESWEGEMSCLQFFQELIDKYKKVIILCSSDNSNFCKVLKDFKEE
ncbi:PIR Superfamily Protein [Plasmodium ovale curtisi]|uniref:PIR Superfamily Protein n=1 Tax=Plasmodium ovale curtisi TaxID=864141 RepID=A0A1A8VQL9_PLAOA|nr:PIR Superfamily Protein [Plasmodium ovale curtisi]